MFDRPFLAEVIEFVSELRSTVAVDDHWRAVRRDERGDVIRDLSCRGGFSAFEDVGESRELVGDDQKLAILITAKVHVK